jgi:beta-lactamase regulating signal transducer with metallopeptidase domain/HEAT repeat protein
MTVVEGVGWVLVHFLWQGAAIAVLLRLVFALLAPSRPVVRYALGCSALALMIAAPLMTAAMLARPSVAAPAAASDGRFSEFPVSDARPSDARSRLADARASNAAADAGAPGAGLANRAGRPEGQQGQARPQGAAGWTLPPSIRARVTATLPWLVGAWAIGVMLLSVRLAGGWWRTRALRTRGVEEMPDVCQRMAARLLARMRITRPVAFFVSSRVTAPIVFGHVKPVVLVPAAVLAGLSPSQLEAILLHELAHVRRHDYLVNLLQTVVETVFFYHPAVWWVSRQVRQAREECCDDIAVAACGDRKDYVEALLGLEQMRHAAATVALAATGGSLLARARRLLIDTEHEGTSPRLTASVIAIAVAALAMAGISMAATEPVTSLKARTSPASQPTQASQATQGPQASQGPQAPQPAQPARKPQAVIAAPDPSAPFAARRAWAEREAKARNASQYWFGYSIRPVKGLHPMIYFDRGTTVMGSEGARFSGHFFSDRMDGLRFSGRPLAVADADAAAIKVLLLLDTRGGAPRLSRLHASTLPIPFEANGRPIFWIGSADTASSLAMIDGLYAAASADDLKNDLIAAAGIHDDSPAVVAWLTQRVQGGDSDKVRAEAVEALAWHPIPASLSGLERAARQDRASIVRREAAEALGDLAMPEAAPVLIALAKSLDDLDARREAIEALGGRPEVAARDALAAIVREDASADMQREAVEALADLRDGRGVGLLIEIVRTHASEDVRAEAAESLADAALPSAEIVQVLKQIAMSDRSLQVRNEAIEALADLKDGQGLDALIEIARDHTDHDTRKEALEALTDSNDPKARKLFEQVLQKPSRD